LEAKRIQSIDILRGIVMVIMALDHTRDYFSNYHFSPTDLEHASTFMFFTRWITHYCAPIFIFLSGCSAFLSLRKGKTKSEASLFLLTRGIWLIILELTIVRFGWLFDMDFSLVVVQVIWAIGWSMIALSVLVFLPRSIILALGLVMVFGHNMLDGIVVDKGNTLWWSFLHVQNTLPYYHQNVVIIAYPIVPWIGVMALGYCFGAIMMKGEAERNKWLYGIGLSSIVLFIILRGFNIYGDMSPWVHQGAWWRDLLSILNCTKYPPSLLYLLMTIGPGIAVLPLLERWQGRLPKFFTVYGRVPMFYYILHIYLIHTMALVLALFMKVPAHYFVGGNAIFAPKPNWGFNLPMVYMFWVIAILLLYYPCRWFMKIKMSHKKWWLSYI
jgi:uncharacterized membrane protein